MSLKALIKKFVYRLRGEYTVETLRNMGMTVGNNFNPQLGVYLDPSHCWLISIGDDVTIAPHAQLLAHDASTCQALGYAKIGRINIGSRVFIGAGAIVLPNVTIGNDVVIGAGSVVTHSLEGGNVYAGNPARVICSLDDYLEKNKEQMTKRPLFDESFTLRQNIPEGKKAVQKQELKDGIGYVV